MCYRTQHFELECEDIELEITRRMFEMKEQPKLSQRKQIAWPSVFNFQQSFPLKPKREVDGKTMKGGGGVALRDYKRNTWREGGRREDCSPPKSRTEME